MYFLVILLHNLLYESDSPNKVSLASETMEVFSVTIVENIECRPSTWRRTTKYQYYKTHKYVLKTNLSSDLIPARTDLKINDFPHLDNLSNSLSGFTCKFL